MARKTFQRKDRFYTKAKEQGYPARSAYKIMELDDRFGIFKPGRVVVDLGCAPGGWLKVGEERLKRNGTMIGIDLLPLQYQPARNTFYKQGDFTTAEMKDWLKSQLKRQPDWVISDLSPDLTGIKFKDQLASLDLCKQALAFAVETLKPGGSFVCKFFPGAEAEELIGEIKKHFKRQKTVIPEATRASSKEIYLLGLTLR